MTSRFAVASVSTILVLGATALLPLAASATSATGGISGQVTDVGGTPLAGVTVNFIGTSSHLIVASKATGTTGRYSDTALPSGSYFVCFDPGTGNHGGHSTDGYTYQCWLNKTSAQTPDAVSVAAGKTTSGIGVALHANGGVSGLVTDTNGVPLAGAVIQVDPSVSDLRTTTSANGRYLIVGVPSQQVVVCAVGPSTGGGPYGWAPKCWRADQTYNNPTLVLVKPGMVTPNIDLRLGKNGALTGAITNPSSAPLPNVEVTLHPLAVGGTDSSFTTATGGTFEFDDLAPGFYTVCAADASGTACWQNTVPASPTPIVVPQTVKVRGITIVLPS